MNTGLSTGDPSSWLAITQHQQGVNLVQFGVVLLLIAGASFLMFGRRVPVNEPPFAGGIAFWVSALGGVGCVLWGLFEFLTV